MSMDFFSGHSNIYAEFRPGYPKALYEFLLMHVPGRSNAWDCATGNGQVAVDLVKYFKHVEATDLSENQLQHAASHPGINYSVSSAEHTTFPEKSFDLVTVGQAAHWLNLEQFYTEARRVLKPNGLLAVWGYSICRVDPAINAVLDHYYTDVVGSYWPPRRKLIDERYATIPFPFKELDVPLFQIEQKWSLDHFIGYLTSWTATQNYMRETKKDPTVEVRSFLESMWQNDEPKDLTFPIFGRIGIVN